MALTRPLSRDWGDRISKATGSRGPGVKGQEGIQRKGAGMFKVLRRERAWLGKVSRSGVGGPNTESPGHRAGVPLRSGFPCRKDPFGCESKREDQPVPGALLEHPVLPGCVS